MVDDQDLAGLDPYDIMAIEAARLDAFFSGASAADWDKPTRCEGWNVRALLAHLAASEEYNQACLDGTVQEFLAGVGAKGAVDLASANEIGIHEFDGQSPEQILETWRTHSTQNRDGFRARDGADVDSSVGAYPGRWQAFHLAFELATHADDVGVPVTAAEAPGRLEWQARFGRFALKELKPELDIEANGDRVHVKGDGIDVDLSEAEFVDAVAARVPADADIDVEAAAILSATP
jgi:uncharacterized protein (TIGR03083 family)